MKIGVTQIERSRLSIDGPQSRRRRHRRRRRRRRHRCCLMRKKECGDGRLRHQETIKLN